jgi:hypothetical protein
LLPVTSPTSATASDAYSPGVIVEKTDSSSEFRMLTEISKTEYDEISAALVAVARIEDPFHYKVGRA